MGLPTSYLAIFVVFVSHSANCKTKSDVGLTPPQIIANHGYPVEIHEVQTEDGYLITMYRIPHGLNDTVNSLRIPIYLMHGLGGYSADYISSGNSRSLGLILADLGYDVWLGNARGTTCSSKHVAIDPVENPKAFFNYSWHEIGTKDLPACIDYILNKTGVPTLHYVGHSQGATAFYVMVSCRPEYNEKIRLATLLAPPGYMGNAPERLYHIVGAFIQQIEKLIANLGIFHIPYVAEIRLALRRLCSKDQFRDSCFRGYSYFLGYEDYKQFDWELLPVFLTNDPADISLKQLYHYAQEIHSGHFRQYDHGEAENLKAYGTVVPPDYNLSAIIAPVAIYYGNNDKMVSVQDVRRTATELPNVVKDYLIPYKKFNHGDFAFAVDARTLLYDEVIRTIQEY